VSTWQDLTRKAADLLQAEPYAPEKVRSELLAMVDKGVESASGALHGAILGSALLEQAIYATLGPNAANAKRHRAAFEAACLAFVACERALRGEPSP